MTYSSIVHTPCAYSASVPVMSIIDSMARDTISNIKVDLTKDSIIMTDDRVLPEQTKKVILTFLDNLLGNKNYYVEFDKADYQIENSDFTRYIFNR